MRTSNIVSSPHRTRVLVNAPTAPTHVLPPPCRVHVTVERDESVRTRNDKETPRETNRKASHKCVTEVSYETAPLRCPAVTETCVVYVQFNAIRNGRFLPAPPLLP